MELDMTLMLKVIISLFGVVFVLGIYNKIQERREYKKMMDQIQKDKEKNRRPSSSYTLSSEDGYK